MCMHSVAGCARASLAVCERWLVQMALTSARECAGMRLECALVQRVHNPGLSLERSCISRLCQSVRAWAHVCVWSREHACARDRSATCAGKAFAPSVSVGSENVQAALLLLFAHWFPCALRSV